MTPNLFAGASDMDCVAAAQRYLLRHPVRPSSGVRQLSRALRIAHGRRPERCGKAKARAGLSVEALAAAGVAPRPKYEATRPRLQLVVLAGVKGEAIVSKRGDRIEIKIATHIDRSRYRCAHDGGGRRKFSGPLSGDELVRCASEAVSGYRAGVTRAANRRNARALRKVRMVAAA